MKRPRNFFDMEARPIFKTLFHLFITFPILMTILAILLLEASP